VEQEVAEAVQEPLEVAVQAQAADPETEQVAQALVAVRERGVAVRGMRVVAVKWLAARVQAAEQEGRGIVVPLAE
jgi:hypothetical protein